MRKIKVKNLKDTLNSCPGLDFLWEPGEIKEIDAELAEKYVKNYGEGLEIISEKAEKKAEKVLEEMVSVPKKAKKTRKKRK